MVSRIADALAGLLLAYVWPVDIVHQMLQAGLRADRPINDVAQNRGGDNLQRIVERRDWPTQIGAQALKHRPDVGHRQPVYDRQPLPPRR